VRNVGGKPPNLRHWHIVYSVFQYIFAESETLVLIYINTVIFYASLWWNEK